MVQMAQRHLYPGFPRLGNLNDLANSTHLSKGLLFKLSTRHDWYYRTYLIPKPSGGTREIAEPARPLKAVQAWILSNILNRILPADQATGFRRNCNILDNARAHEHNKHILCLDMDAFFPSIRYSAIYIIFWKLGYNKHISHILASLCTFKDRLPQGGITSPALSNLVCFRLDCRIAGYCGPRNISYTRYADDMTFSSMDWRRLPRVHTVAGWIIEDEGFTLNERKTRYMGPKRRQKVTGLIIGNNKAGIGREAERQLRLDIWKFCKYRQSPNIGVTEMKLQGFLSFLHSVDLERYRRICNYISRLSTKFPSIGLEQRLRVT